MSSMVSPGTYWRTIRHLQRRQILARVRWLLSQQPTQASPQLQRRALHGCFGEFIRRPGPIRRHDCFRFLNRSCRITKPADWNNYEQSKLWLYNLHYFEWLRETTAPGRTAEDGAWLDRWIADNPVGRGVGWDPYPVSLRIVNWIIWFLNFSQGTESEFKSLATQARHLSRSIEYHLGGNHLLANAMALVFAGTFFEGIEADGWRLYGLKLLGEELHEQILPDGAHFELSPMYHSLVLEGLLDLLGLSRAYPEVLAAPIAEIGLVEAASRMAQWLSDIRHPDGEIPYFNDAAFGIAPSPGDLLAHAARRGIVADRSGGHLVVLRASGLAIISRPPFHLVFDCGRIGPDYLPAHAHADTLSFELSIAGHRLISNSGTSTYERGSERDWERSTAAHATIEIDGSNSAETWAGFRVGRRPNAVPVEFATNQSHDWIEAAHDGFSYLRGSPIHRRRVSVTAGEARVQDLIEGRGVHAARGFLPIHPGTAIESVVKNSFRLHPPGIDTVEINIDGPVEATVQTGRFAVGFGNTVARLLIEWKWHGTLPVSVETRLTSGSGV